MDKDLKMFLDDTSISIRKFLEDYYDFYYDKSFKGRNKRWRLKHQEITFLPNIVTVPLNFCGRYRDLVYQGKIIVVKDEYGKYVSYVSPSLIRIVSEEDRLKEGLKELGIEDYSSNAIVENDIKQIKETKRIMSKFHGEKEIALVNNLNNAYRRERKND